MRNTQRTIAAALLCAFLGCGLRAFAQVPDVPERVQALLERGDRRRLDREFAKAKDSYEEAKRVAAASGDKAARFLTDLYIARAVLDSGDAETALRTLEGLEGDLASVRGFDPAYYYYFRGHLRERTATADSVRAALADYERAGALPVAASAGLRLLEKLRPDDKGRRALTIVGKMTGAGRHRDVLEPVLRLLGEEDWARDDSAPALLGAVVECLGRLPVTPPEFQSRYRKELSRPATHETLRSAVKEIERAYAVDYPVRLDREWVRGQLFPWWSRSESRRRQLSHLLLALGRYFDGRPGREGNARAMACYSAGFMVDEHNLDSALYSAAALRDANWPPARKADLQKELIDDVFDEKDAQYRLAWKSANDPEIWKSIRGFHTLLGQLFEQEGRWEPEDRPQSAIFQWTFALQADARLRQLDPGAPRVWGLHERLGRALAGAGRVDRARDAYVKALGETRERNPLEIGRVYASFRSLGMISERSEPYRAQLEDQLNASFQAGSPGIRTPGPLAGSDTGGFYVAGRDRGSVHVLRTSDRGASRVPPSQQLAREKFAEEIAGEFQAPRWRDVRVLSMALDPGTGNVFFSIVAPGGRPPAGLARMDPSGRLSRMDTRGVPYSVSRWARRSGTSARMTGAVTYHGQAIVSESISQGDAPPEDVLRFVSFLPERSHVSSGTPIRAFSPRSGRAGFERLRALAPSEYQRPSGGGPPGLDIVALFDGGLTTFTPADLQPGVPLSLPITTNFEGARSPQAVVALRRNGAIHLVVACHAPGLLLLAGEIPDRAGEKMSFRQVSVLTPGRFEALAKIDEHDVLALERKDGAPDGMLQLRPIRVP